MDRGGNAWAEKSTDWIRSMASVVIQQLQMNVVMRFQPSIHCFRVHSVTQHGLLTDLSPRQMSLAMSLYTRPQLSWEVVSVW